MSMFIGVREQCCEVATFDEFGESSYEGESSSKLRSNHLLVREGITLTLSSPLAFMVESRNAMT